MFGLYWLPWAGSLIETKILLRSQIETENEIRSLISLVVGLRPIQIWSLILSSLRSIFGFRSLILHAIILRPYLLSVS